MNNSDNAVKYNKADIMPLRPCGGRGNCSRCNICADYRIPMDIETTNENIRPDIFPENPKGDVEDRSNTCCDGERETDYKGESGTDHKGENRKANKGERIGLAIDIGTTTVVAAIYDLTTGELIETRSMINPQIQIATDVMGRISADMAGGREKLTSMIHSCLETLAGPDMKYKYDRCVITANTVMLYLLTGADTAPLGIAPYKADLSFGSILKIAENFWAYVPPIFGAFVGADITTAIAYSNICNKSSTALLIDVGTNGEIALWKDNRLHVTSTAAGPAFEKRGVHGSDMIDAIAQGLKEGIIDDTGYLCQEEKENTGAEDGMFINNILITQKDIRGVQLSKAAISAGIKTLLEETKTSVEEVEDFYIAGTFGTHLDLENASLIGLFPKELIAHAHVIGNAALKGAARALTEPELKDTFDSITKNAIVINLGGNASFNERYIDEMMFKIENLNIF